MLFYTHGMAFGNVKILAKNTSHFGYFQLCVCIHCSQRPFVLASVHFQVGFVLI